MLKLIASHDQLIQMCGTDIELAKKFSSVFTDWQTTFDPVISLASNPEYLVKGFDFWTKAGSISKRKFGTFDEDKYTKFFVNKRKEFLEKEKKEYNLKRNGFDAFAYLLAYEDEIVQMYELKKDFTNLQKAALHFVEIGLEEKEVDYVKYIASYDDLIEYAKSSKPEDQTWEQWLPEVGKTHYENTGRLEIMNGVRPVNKMFDPDIYLASYPTLQSDFKTDDGKIDRTKLTISFITSGSSNGFVRNAFNAYAFIANDVDVLKEDIYTNKKVDVKKVVPIWLKRIAENAVDLTKFNPEEYKHIKEITTDDNLVVYAQYVNEQFKLMKDKKKLFKMMMNKFSLTCVTPKFK